MSGKIKLKLKNDLPEFYMKVFLVKEEFYLANSDEGSVILGTKDHKIQLEE